MRAKALNDPEFPNENLISEFLIRKDKISKLDLEWKKPQMLSFVVRFFVITAAKFVFIQQF